MSPETIDAMIAAGVTAEVLAAAWKAEIAKQEETLEQRRAKDAERQRRHRESRDVTVTGRDVTETPCSLEVSPQTPLPKPINPAPLNPPSQEEKIRAVGKCLKQAFPVDLPEWMPSDSYAEFRAMRKKMRNVPFEAGAERRAIAKITRLRDEGHDPEKLISKAIENGHRTFFPDESTKQTGAMPLTADEQQAYAGKYAQRLEEQGRSTEAADIRRRYSISVGEAVAKIVRAA